VEKAQTDDRNHILEMQEKQIYERSVAAASGIDMSRIRLATNFLNNEKTLFDEGNALLEQETNVYVFTGMHTVNSIRSAIKKYGLDIVFIDYLQLIEPVTKRQNRATEVADITRGLKTIAGEFKIPIVALSQIKRVSEMLKDKEPSMSELRESGAIEQDAAVIIMLWDDINPVTKKVEGKFQII
jgi:replicative DNA helicase